MDLERERGITIKAHPVTMSYKAKDGHTYKLNLMDTPGHVDFAYEVSRSLAACEGALLIVDAAQGVEAQTVANVHLAQQAGAQDHPGHQQDRPAQFRYPDGQAAARGHPRHPRGGGDPRQRARPASASRISSKPSSSASRIRQGNNDDKLRALVFDSTFDTYRGVIIYVRVVDGQIKAGDPVKIDGDKQGLRGEGSRHLPARPRQDDRTGQTLQARRRRLRHRQYQDDRRGQGRRHDDQQSRCPRTCRCRVSRKSSRWSSAASTRSIPPTSSTSRRPWASSSSTIRPFVYHGREFSVALGFGFRCGFLGLLHMEIIQERLRREYDMDIIATYPSVIYEVHKDQWRSAQGRQPGESCPTPA